MTTFNAKLWAARVNPNFEVHGLDDAVNHYLAKFAHKGCGGAPATENHRILCTVCKQAWKWVGPLGAAIAKLPFKSLIVGAK